MSHHGFYILQYYNGRVFTPHCVEMPLKRGTARSQGLPPSDLEAPAPPKKHTRGDDSDEDLFDDPKKQRKKSPEAQVEEPVETVQEPAETVQEPAETVNLQKQCLQKQCRNLQKQCRNFNVLRHQEHQV
jgi:hypothetical protein